MIESDVLDDFLSHGSGRTAESLPEKFVRVSLDKGQFAFFEGDTADSMYLLESGVLEANVVHGDGRIYIFHFLFQGEIFGEGILSGREVRPFSVMARDEASILKIGRDDMLRAVESDAELRGRLLEIIGYKLDTAYHKARCIAGEKVEKRLVCVLLKSIRQNGIDPYCGERLDTPITNRDISGLIGSTEETVSRIMSRFKKKGVVGLENKHLVVLDRQALIDNLHSD